MQSLLICLTSALMLFLPDFSSLYVLCSRRCNQLRLDNPYPMMYLILASSVDARYNIPPSLTLLLPILRPKESHISRSSQSTLRVVGSYRYTQLNRYSPQALKNENTTHTRAQRNQKICHIFSAQFIGAFGS